MSGFCAASDTGGEAKVSVVGASLGASACDAAEGFRGAATGTLGMIGITGLVGALAWLEAGAG